MCKRFAIKPQTISLRRLLKCGFVLIVLVAGLPTSISQAQGITGVDANEAERMLDFNTVELRIQLRSGLRVFLPEQDDFLNTVLANVDAGQLPRAMVNMVYVWAIRRNPKVPFPYFEYAMRALAERRGVTL